MTAAHGGDLSDVPYVLDRQMSGKRLLAYWLMAVGFAVVGTAIVVYLYSTRILPIAGPFALLVWLPMLFLIRATVLDRRNRRWNREFRLRLDRTADQLAREQALPAQQRLSQASDASLGRFALQLNTARATLAQDQLYDAAAQTAALAQVATDWTPSAPLSRELQRTVHAAQRLAAIWEQSSALRN